MIAGAMLNTRIVFLRQKADRKEEDQVLNLGEFDAAIYCCKSEICKNASGFGDWLKY